MDTIEYVVTLKMFDVQSGKLVGTMTKKYDGSKSKLFQTGIADATKTLLANAGYLSPIKSKGSTINPKDVLYAGIAVVTIGAIVGVVVFATQKKETDEVLTDTIPLAAFPSRSLQEGAASFFMRE